MTTSWTSLVCRLLLVLGLVAGPWPAAMAVSNPAAYPHAPATQPMQGDAPCPMEEAAAVFADDAGPASPPCHCCGDGAACDAMQCVVSTPAPGLPAGAPAVAVASDRTIHDAVLIPRSPEPRPGERLRPPIA